jgi:hypothetical protein
MEGMCINMMMMMVQSCVSVCKKTLSACPRSGRSPST